MKSNKIYCVDVLNGLKNLKDDSIDCIVTSPPYWALRDYDTKGQIGLEINPEDYISKIVEIMKECKRVLKPTGTIWLNLGDSFYSNCSSGARNNLFKKYRKASKKELNKNWLQNKQRLLIPYRIAIKCQDELGLILRNDITWVKQWCNFKTKESAGTAMPSAVIDRLNTNSESLFFFVKQNKYYFDLDAIRVPYKIAVNNPKGKNPGDCIIFPLEPSRERHFAMFPSTLPEFCIKAGCPQEVCKKCGTPRFIIKTGGNSNAFNFRVRDVKKGRIKSGDRKASEKEVKDYKEKDYISKEKKKVVLGCNCKAGFKPGVVLDPFMGSGTTALVSKKLDREFIGFDLNKEYIKIALRRLRECN